MSVFILSLHYCSDCVVVWPTGHNETGNHSVISCLRCATEDALPRLSLHSQMGWWDSAYGQAFRGNRKMLSWQLFVLGVCLFKYESNGLFPGVWIQAICFHIFVIPHSCTEQKLTGFRAEVITTDFSISPHPLSEHSSGSGLPVDDDVNEFYFGANLIVEAPEMYWCVKKKRLQAPGVQQ